jgi:hypothetical protein
LLGGTMLSANTLALNAGPTTYDRAQVFVNGTNAATLVAPALPAFSFKSADRGMVERVDLLVSLPVGSSTKNDLTFIDSDGDGVSDADELRAGTNPHDPNDYLHFTSIRKRADGDVELEWLSVTNRAYTVSRATDLRTSAYSVLRSNISGRTPTTTLLDTNASASGPYFYRLTVD